ncbi:hypothetical protein RIF29_30002 [Crotalaria pallida]|uniref:Uncharacterized protein n=1 Tax=Crotalaria pallida TaxID=3830 RepID=A0AAN9EGE4_CROPI
MFRLMRNLDNIRPGLKDLNNRKYRDIDMREIQARKRLDSIQDMLQLDPLNNHLQKMEKEARKEHLEEGYEYLMGELQVFNHHRLIWNPARRRQVVICSLIVYGAVN